MRGWAREGTSRSVAPSGALSMESRSGERGPRRASRVSAPHGPEHPAPSALPRDAVTMLTRSRDYLVRPRAVPSRGCARCSPCSPSAARSAGDPALRSATAAERSSSASCLRCASAAVRRARGRFVGAPSARVGDSRSRERVPLSSTRKGRGGSSRAGRKAAARPLRGSPPTSSRRPSPCPRRTPSSPSRRIPSACCVAVARPRSRSPEHSESAGGFPWQTSFAARVRPLRSADEPSASGVGTSGEASSRCATLPRSRASSTTCTRRGRPRTPVPGRCGPRERVGSRSSPSRGRCARLQRPLARRHDRATRRETPCASR